MHMNPDEYRIHIGARPLCWATDIDSKPYIWNCNVAAISFEAQLTGHITGGGKDHNPTYFRPTERRCHPHAPAFNSVELCYMEGRR